MTISRRLYLALTWLDRTTGWYYNWLVRLRMKIEDRGTA